MKTLSKFAAAAALLAVFAGASASEATVDEIVVIGKRPAQALPRIEVERPIIPALQIEPIVPVIKVTVVEIASVRGEARPSGSTGS
jgi:hypothetical protein